MRNYLTVNREIKAKSLTLFFNYSFLFTSFNLESIIEKNGDESKTLEALSKELVVPKEFIKVFTAGSKYYRNIESSIINPNSKFDKYLAPYLYLKVSYIEISYPDIIGSVEKKYHLLKWKIENQEFNAYKNCDINLDIIKRQILIMENGQGIETIELQFTPAKGNYLTPLDIVYLSNICMRRRKLHDTHNREFSLFKITTGDKEFFVFDQFYNDVIKLYDVLNKLINQTRINTKFQWIEIGSENQLVGDISTWGSELHFQDPFPIISVTVSDEVYADCFLDEIQRKSIYYKKSIRLPRLFDYNKSIMMKELLMILYRSKLPFFQDISFALNSGILVNDKIINMCSNSAVFIHLYSRSGLIVRTENTFLKSHAEYIIPAFIETVQYLRMRWHAYVVATQWLEKITESLTCETESFIKVLKKIIEARRVISGALSDPLAYRIGSGSMNKIYETGLSIFRIQDLQKIVIEKFSWIESLFNNLFQYERIKDLDELNKKIIEINSK